MAAQNIVMLKDYTTEKIKIKLCKGGIYKVKDPLLKKLLEEGFARELTTKEVKKAEKILKGEQEFKK